MLPHHQNNASATLSRLLQSSSGSPEEADFSSKKAAERQRGGLVVGAPAALERSDGASAADDDSGKIKASPSPLPRFAGASIRARLAAAVEHELAALPQALREARLEAQRAAQGGRLGHWLVRQQGVSEELVTRALGLQWSSPVLGVEFHDAAALAPLLPRFFIDAFGALPLRVAAGRLLYLGFEERLDPVVSLSVERMTGLRVESGLVQGSHFRAAHTRMLSAAYPPVRLVEVASEPVLVDLLSRAVERARPVEARLVRVHDCLWLRMWRRARSGPVPEQDSGFP